MKNWARFGPLSVTIRRNFEVGHEVGHEVTVDGLTGIEAEELLGFLENMGNGLRQQRYEPKTDPGPQRAHTTSSGVYGNPKPWQGRVHMPPGFFDGDPFQTVNRTVPPPKPDFENLEWVYKKFFEEFSKRPPRTPPSPKASPAKRHWREILGGPKTKDEAKAAYKKLALELHPDRPTGNQALFIEATEAYNQAYRELP
jgi:hypothetical protein